MKIKLLFLPIVISFLFNSGVSAVEYYPRHYIILVDQTKDLQIDDKTSFFKVFSFIKNNLEGAGDQSFVFDEKNDEISLYTFALSGDGRMGGKYGDIHRIASSGNKEKAYNVFVNNLIWNQARYSSEREKGVSIETFINNKLRPLFNAQSNHFKMLSNKQVGAVTFSKYVFPAILESEHFNFSTPASEYIIIIASNFQSGLDDIGTSQDRNTLIQMLGEQSQGVKTNLNYFEGKFNTLADPFYQIPLFKKEYPSSNQRKNAQPTALGYKLGLKSLQGVSTYITSNIDLKQTEFESSKFKIGVTNITFNHGNDLVLDSVKLKVFKPDVLQEIYGCTISEGNPINGDYQRNLNTQSYDFGERTIDLGSCGIDDTLEFKYIFYTTIKNEEQTIMPMVFVANRNVVLSESFFYPKFTIFEKMFFLFVFIALIVSIILGWITYNKRGQSVLRGISVKIWHISNSRFMDLKDYHVVDQDCWYMRRGENQRLINITGSVDMQKMSFARPYQLKVEYKIEDVDNNEDFSFRPEGQENTGEKKVKSKWYEVPLNSDGTFEINALAYQVDGHTLDLEGRHNILKMKVSVKAELYKGKEIISHIDDFAYYSFIVRPEITNAALWMAFDPGTSGACVAYGIGGNPTDKTNIKIAYNTEKDSSGKETKVSIFPSKIKIPDSSSIITKRGKVTMSELEEATEYGGQGDFYFGNLAKVHEGRNSFQSIKKLLGYNDTHVLVDENREEVCKLSGRDLALLLVKGLCNHFEEYIRTNQEVSDKERDLFISKGKFTPSRAIVAVPNNYTIVKAQDMVDSVKRTGLFKEVHYLYEAEGVMMCYLRNSWDSITNNPQSYEENGKYFVVFDMGGATINTTAFTINVITAQNENNKYIREIELSTKARVGYNVGGDDIDYSWIRILYGIPSVVNYLKENNIDSEEHIKKHRTGLLKFVQRLKLDWMSRLAFSQELSDEDIERLWMDIASDNGLPDLDIVLPTEIDEDSALYLRNEWIQRTNIKKYVFSSVENAITELISTISANSIDIIFSGRTSLYPGIRQIVIESIKSKYGIDCTIWDGLEKSDTSKSADEVVKTAVATGACWYAMFSNMIKLNHNIVTSTFGYVDLKNGKSTFIPLINRGAELDSSGNLTSDSNKKVLTPNLPNVRILQMLTSKHEYVMNGLNSANKSENDKVKHLVNQLVHLTSEEIHSEIKGVVVSVDDKNNFTYEVKLAGEKALTGVGTINDADIKTENSDAYAFSAMPCTEDETKDLLNPVMSIVSGVEQHSTISTTDSTTTSTKKTSGKKRF